MNSVRKGERERVRERNGEREDRNDNGERDKRKIKL